MVTATFDSTVLGPLKVTQDPLSGVNIGDPIQLTLSYDNSQVIISDDPVLTPSGSVLYQCTTTLSSISLSINGTAFSQAYDQANLGISVWNKTLLSVWGNQDGVEFTKRIDTPLANYFSVVFSGAGAQDILNDNSLPTLAQLAAFSYICGDIDMDGHTMQSGTPAILHILRRLRRLRL